MTGEEPDWLRLLRLHTGRFADVISDADLGAPVSSCPGWSLRDLVVHVGGVHQWASHCVVEGNPEFRPEPAAREGPELIAWYRHHASRLVEVLTATPADAPAWTLDDRDATALFWRRRQVHEIVLHTCDADEALGHLRQVDPWLAWDGVLEVRDVMYPRQVRLGRVDPLSRGIRMIATDVPGDVTIGNGESVAVRGRAEVLLRLLWHRADPAAEMVDPRAGELLSGALTP
ncbi:maleylpyruvate isomerase family mycothiol-dependent enzyme [Blastococcus goldschmidtiae]|uniref:Maleylpyruvate isomerase family mycothiol-dependent enzyme n=1 Tax=Blastococcus goldschmidtiae TaxID=3075546 RepID=A0ABU2KD33_9ACTN|nr:maleylpyruvate isomerase family mycothiol-dependent enzyme [Blastococcus sp. DSM 46792]MDT0278103.1 maleylpyruvate isomerase family mycothiol-dependent enzyme [Blastococcus sp. DSM 46792]